MKTVLSLLPSSRVALIVAASFAVTMPMPLAAQDEVTEARMRKVEAEIRALQRKVFPGGDERFFEPQITPQQTETASDGPVTSTTAVTDILARLDSIELQLQRLTALSEENFNGLTTLEERVTALEVGAGATNATTATVVDTSGSADPDLDGSAQEPESRAMDSNLAAMTDGASSGQDAVSSDATGGPTAERLAAVQAITKPQTDDPADDEYSYGFRLWNAGFYPEARQQLTKYVEDYPDHFRISYGRNLLGRAYLDDGMPEEAARWFLRNYQADRTARRAPDSLLFLAESMILRNEADDMRRACIALTEFGETYPALATGRLADQYQSNLGKVTCTQS